MKKILPILLLLALVSLACSVNINLTPEPSTGGGGAPPTTDTGGGVVAPPTEFVPAPPTTVPANVLCNNVSFYLPPSLGSSFSCETIPEEPGGADMPYFAINPQFTKITIHGYPLADRFFEPTIKVYPYPRFQALIPEIGGEYTDLQGLLAGGLPGENSLPFLPYMGAAQIFHAQYAIVPFYSGSGIRYLTEFAQYTAPINNHDMFYTFQGITSDGLYWVSAILPASHPILPANSDNPPGGMSWETFSNNYEPYLVDIKSQLNAQSWETFTPQLGLLDDLIASMTIQP